MSLTAESWFYKYSPKTPDEYVFETDDHRNRVMSWISDGFIPGNLVLFGPAGTGKSALSELLIKALIKHQADLNVILELSAKTIDELPPWLEQKPRKSKQKIVFIEEFDRLHPAAQNSLKNRKMEKYQSYCTYIATTNHINRIDKALQTRFTHKFNMGNPNVDGVSQRLHTILTSEGIQFEPTELTQFVHSNIQLGIRDLINTLQVGAVNGTIDFNSVELQKSAQEEELVNVTIGIINAIMSITDVNDKKMALINPMSSSIAPYYSTVLQITQYNHNLNYISVFTRLSEQVQYLPIQQQINHYLQTLERSKILPHVHYISFVCDCIKCIMDITL